MLTGPNWTLDDVNEYPVVLIGVLVPQLRPPLYQTNPTKIPAVKSQDIITQFHFPALQTGGVFAVEPAGKLIAVGVASTYVNLS